MIEEALNIILINKSKAKSLRITLINNLDTLDTDNAFILKIRQYLGEFEYDLAILYDIIKELKSLIDIEQNNINDSINNAQDKSHIIKNNEIRASINNLKKNNSFKISNRYKKNLYLNNSDEDEDENSQFKNKKRNKTYNFTINICDDSHYNSKQRKKFGKIIKKSNSYKSFKRKNSLENISYNNNNDYYNNNKNIPNSYRASSNKNYADKFLNNFDSKDFIYNDNSLSKNNRFNNNHYTYMTDYSSNEKNYLNQKHNLLNSNINKNRMSIENINNIYKHYNSLINNNNDKINDNKLIINDNNLEMQINKILASKNSKTSQNNYISRLNLENILDDNYNEINNNYMENCMNNDERYFCDKNNPKKNYKYIINNETNEREKEKEKEKGHILLNKNLKRYEIFSKFNNKIETNKNEDFLEEDKKSEIIQNIISILLQDANKLNVLKKHFGEEIGEKLLKGDVNLGNIFKIVEILKSYQKNLKINTNNKNEKNLFRGSRKNYTQFKNKKDDNILLKETLNNNEYLI